MSELIYNVFLTSGILVMIIVAFIRFVSDMNVSYAVKKVSVIIFISNVMVFLVSAIALIWV